MPDVNQLFRAATQHARPVPGALARQLAAQRRRSRNRKLSALAVAAVIVAAVALFAANALNLGQHGSIPGDPVPSGLTLTVLGTDGSVRSSMQVPAGTKHADVSPDGTKVAFVIARGPDSQIATMRLDGTDLHIITSESLDTDRPRWSPDGEELLFSEGSDSTGRQLMVMHADGSNVRRIAGTRNPEDVPADWSPDGTLILYTSLNKGSRDLATVPSVGGLSHRLTTNRQINEGPGTWSPDGSLITYTHDDGFGNEVWVMNADGRGRHPLVSFPEMDAIAPEWSPDGSMIAFIGASGLGATIVLHPGADSLYVVEVATGDVTEIYRGIANFELYDSRATWLPDGNTLLVMSQPT